MFSLRYWQLILKVNNVNLKKIYPYYKRYIYMYVLVKYKLYNIIIKKIKSFFLNVYIFLFKITFLFI